MRRWTFVKLALMAFSLSGMDAYKENGLIVSGSFIQEGNGGRLAELDGQHRGNPSGRLPAQIREETAREQDESLTALFPDNVQFEKSILAAMARLGELQGK